MSDARTRFSGSWALGFAWQRQKANGAVGGTRRQAETGAWLEVPRGQLDRELTIKAINGVVRTVQDDLEDTYDQCFEESGQTACTYKR